MRRVSGVRWWQLILALVVAATLAFAASVSLAGTKVEYTRKEAIKAGKNWQDCRLGEGGRGADECVDEWNSYKAAGDKWTKAVSAASGK